jgi:hypothetical protein
VARAFFPRCAATLRHAGLTIVGEGGLRYIAALISTHAHRDEGRGGEGGHFGKHLSEGMEGLMGKSAGMVSRHGMAIVNAMRHLA